MFVCAAARCAAAGEKPHQRCLRVGRSSVNPGPDDPGVQRTGIQVAVVRVAVRVAVGAMVRVYDLAAQRCSPGRVRRGPIRVPGRSESRADPSPGPIRVPGRPYPRTGPLKSSLQRAARRGLGLLPVRRPWSGSGSVRVTESLSYGILNRVTRTSRVLILLVTWAHRLPASGLGAKRPPFEHSSYTYKANTRRTAPGRRADPVPGRGADGPGPPDARAETRGHAARCGQPARPETAGPARSPGRWRRFADSDSKPGCTPPRRPAARPGAGAGAAALSSPGRRAHARSPRGT